MEEAKKYIQAFLSQNELKFHNKIVTFDDFIHAKEEY
jgi:hypothetical protein